jgi:hypothetical protein
MQAYPRLQPASFIFTQTPFSRAGFRGRRLADTREIIPGSDNLSVCIQISLRGAIVLIATLIMIRLGHKRSLSRKTTSPDTTSKKTSASALGWKIKETRSAGDRRGEMNWTRPQS